MTCADPHHAKVLPTQAGPPTRASVAADGAVAVMGPSSEPRPDLAAKLIAWLEQPRSNVAPGLLKAARPKPASDAGYAAGASGAAERTDR